MRRNKWIVLTIVFLVGLAVSCQQDVFENGTHHPQNTTFVKQARQFFDRTVATEPIFNLTRSDAPQQILFPGTVIPNWDNPYIYQTDKHRFLFARLEPGQFRYHAMQTDPQNGRSYRTNVHQAAVLAQSLNDEKNWFMGMASFIPDRKTQQAAGRKVLDRYLDHPAHGGFSGKVLFHRISDMAIYAVLVFEDGVPVQRMHPEYYGTYEAYKSDMLDQLEPVQVFTRLAPTIWEMDMDEIEVIHPSDPNPPGWPPIVNPPRPELPDLPNPGGGGGGGGGGTPPPTKDDDQDEEEEIEEIEDCNFPGAAMNYFVTQTLNEIANNSSNFPVRDYDGNDYNFIDLNNYMNWVMDNPNNEWGSIYQKFPSGSQGFYPPIQGSGSSVHIPDIFPDAMASIHNHPTGGPPSVGDIIATGLRAYNIEYRYSIIVNSNNSTVYTVAISDPQKAYEFAQTYKDSYNSSGWLTNSIPGDIYYEIHSELPSFDSFDRHIYALSAVLSDLDAGMVLTKSEGFNPTNTTAYSLKEKDGKPQPVKCSNN